MWIVRLALRNPYSVGVLALIILIAGILSIQSMLVDVFPVVDIPVVGEVWNFPGLSSTDVESRIVTINERALSTTTSGISRIESQSLPGIGNLRIYFEPGTDIGSAVAQISATAETVLRMMPPGITPPIVLPFNASNVPVAQMTLTSDTLPEDKIFDYASELHPRAAVHDPGTLDPRALRRESSARSTSTSIPVVPRPRGSPRRTSTTRCQPPTSSCRRAPRASGPFEYNVLHELEPAQGRGVQSNARQSRGRPPVYSGRRRHGL